METNGIKVSNLNIAQVKRLFEIIERKNYNIGSGKTNQPPLTKEKERAIVDALVCYKAL